MFGSIIPEPFATHVIVASPTLRRERLGVRVGGHDALGADHRIVLQLGRHPANAALDLLDRQLHADHARRAHEHAVGRRAELRGGGRRHASRVLESAFAGRDVAARLFATIARSVLPRIVSRPRMIGAPGNWFRVNTAAAVASTSLTNSVRSFAAGLRPQLRLAQRKPRGKTGESV